jgi:hypothetical protein
MSVRDSRPTGQNAGFTFCLCQDMGVSLPWISRDAALKEDDGIDSGFIGGR